jgi:hypothetical protein
MIEWRVRVRGIGRWASGTWNFCFNTEAEARSFAKEHGGEAYLQDYGAVLRTPQSEAEPPAQGKLL